jgi:hypothetical protein
MDQTEVKKITASIIRHNLSPEVWSWLAETAVLSHHSTRQFNTAFVSIPRKTGRAVIHFTTQQAEALAEARPHFTIDNWTVDRLCRAWILLQVDAAKEDEYFHSIENLFLSAEMNELVALYSSLPLLQYPKLWRNRCTEGIRTNIGTALEAIICNNPYPSEQLTEAAWNQLVMKAFFTDKPIHQVVGLDERGNKDLAIMLSDYANERWAASRTVNPQLWRCVSKFIDEKTITGIQRLFHSANELEKEAAALACYNSNHPAARQLLNGHELLRSKIESGQLTWNVLAKKQMLQPI